MLLLLQEFLGALVRAGVMFAAGWFVQKGILTADQAGRMGDAATAAIVAGLLALGWSLWAKYKNRVRLLTALEVKPGTTEEEVKAIVKNGRGASLPPIASLLLIILLGGAATSCATAGGLGPTATPTAQQAKLAELERAVDSADRVLSIASTIQDLEIAAHQNGRMPDGAHRTVQLAFKEFAAIATSGLQLARDLSKPETTRMDAARSVGAIGFELVGRIEKHLPPEVSVYLTSLKTVLKLLGFSA